MRLALVAAMAIPVVMAAQHAAVPAEDRAQALRDHHPLWAISANDRGAVEPDRIMPQMTMVLARTAAQEAAFEQLLAAQQDPASASYHHWLTPVEVGERFGPSPDQVAAVTAWLESAGLRVNWVAPSRTFIGFTGSAVAVGTAFRTEMHTYTVHGEERLAPSTDPQIPAALAAVVRAVRGLYTVNERPLDRFTALASPSPETTDGGSHFLAPWDFATIYDLPGGLYGNGQTIGIVGEARVDSADISNFNNLTYAGVPDPTEIVPTAFGGVDPGPALTAPPTGSASDGDQGEATLDVLRAGSVAPQARLLLVVATSASGGVGDDAQYLVQTTPVPAQIMTISFGACESESGAAGVDFWDGLFKQAASEGISVFVSSGDSGASGCDTSFITPPAIPAPNSPNVICSSSYATCVGGTEFNDSADPAAYWSTANNGNLGSALGYIPEGAWNEPLNSKGAPEVAATGGGVSKFIATPSWQTGTGVPSARAGRYTPDVSFSASGHDGYFACFAAGQGSCAADSSGEYYFVIFSGTSAAAPGMAGITALLDENAGAAEGNLNPALYQLAGSAPQAFHDVTVSSSGVSGCSVNTPSMCNNSTAGAKALTGGQAGFQVGDGFDEATGLGSLDAVVFVAAYQDQLAPPTINLPELQLPVTFPSSLVGFSQTANFVVENSGSMTMNPMTLAITGTDAGDFSQTNQCGIPLSPQAACPVQLTFTPQAGGNRAATLTLTSSNAGNSPRAIQLVGTGSTTLLVPTVFASPSANLITQYQAMTVQVIVYSPQALYPVPTGSVMLTSGSYTSPAVVLASGIATISVPAGSLEMGQNIVTVTYTADSASSSIYASASSAFGVTVGVIPPSVTETPSPERITTSQAMTVGVAVSGGIGNPTATGLVQVAGSGFTSPVTKLGSGSASINVPAGSLTAGTDVLTATYTPDAASSSIYSTSSITAVVFVTKPASPSFAVGNASLTLYRGATTGNSTNISVTPAGGFTGSVTLTAAITSSPAGAQDLPTISFGATNPVSIIGASAGNAVLTVATTAATSAALRQPAQDGRGPGGWVTAGGAMLAGLLLFLSPGRRRRWQTLLGALALLAVLAGSLAACTSVQGGGGGGGGGNSNPGTTAGTYTVTVTGVSGSETQTGTVTLIVQ
jgi:hypothetical protein